MCLGQAACTHNVPACCLPLAPRRIPPSCRCYLGLVVCLLYNFAGACAMVGLGAPDRMSSWFLAAIYLIAGVPLGLLLWYMKLYNTVAK